MGRARSARARGIFQPYRDLWKLFHKKVVVPQTASSCIYWIAPIVAFTCMLTVPILIPVLTDFPLPQSDMGDILGGGLILTLGIVSDHPGRPGFRQCLRGRRLLARRDAGNSR